jgi:hypothetical protein
MDVQQLLAKMKLRAIRGNRPHLSPFISIRAHALPSACFSHASESELSFKESRPLISRFLPEQQRLRSAA